MTADEDAPGAPPATGQREPSELEAREADLRTGLDELANVVADAVSLERLLEHVAASAVHAIPDADGVGISLLRLDQPDDRIQTLATSHPFVAKVDAIQYQLVDEGPCITAAAGGMPVRTGNVSADPRWPRFGPRVGRLGVHSVLALPMLYAQRFGCRRGQLLFPFSRAVR